MRTLHSSFCTLLPTPLLAFIRLVGDDALTIDKPSLSDLHIPDMEACLASSRLERLLSSSWSDVCSELAFLSSAAEDCVNSVRFKKVEHTQSYFSLFFLKKINTLLGNHTVPTTSLWKISATPYSWQGNRKETPDVCHLFSADWRQTIQIKPESMMGRSETGLFNKLVHRSLFL